MVAGSDDIVFFSLWRPSMLLSIMAVPASGLSFSAFMPVLACIFKNSLYNKYKVISQCGFALYFPDNC